MHIFFNFFSHSSFHIPLPLRFTSPAATFSATLATSGSW